MVRRWWLQLSGDILGVGRVQCAENEGCAGRNETRKCTPNDRVCSVRRVKTFTVPRW